MMKILRSEKQLHSLVGLYTNLLDLRHSPSLTSKISQRRNCKHKEDPSRIFFMLSITFQVDSYERSEQKIYER